MERTEIAGAARAKRAQRGVSLVETVVVLAVAGILVGAAWPRAADLLDVVALRSASVRFASALSRGRIAALSEGRSWRLRLDGATGFVLAPLEGDAVPERLPERVFFASATSGGDVRFFPSGLADNATFTLGVGDARRRVIVNQRGHVTVE
jgi:prepilin-type N-terminal cleavage/methylation domain-containing protein